MGSVCAWNDALSAFDCVTAACEQDLDGDEKPESIPPTGLCADGRVVWCDKGHVRELACLAGVTCGWNAGIGAYDCVPSTGVAPDQDAYGGPSEDVGDAPDAGVSADTSGHLPRGGGVLPVQSDAGSSADVGGSSAATGGTAGCTAAGRSARGAWLTTCGLMLAGLMAARRRGR